jgi:hypothetical protein
MKMASIEPLRFNEDYSNLADQPPPEPDRLLHAFFSKEITSGLCMVMTSISLEPGSLSLIGPMRHQWNMERRFATTSMSAPLAQLIVGMAISIGWADFIPLD